MWTTPMVRYTDTGNYLWIARLQTNYEALQGVRCCPATPAPNPLSKWKAPKDETPALAGAAGTADYPWRWTGSATTYIGSYAINAWCYGNADQVFGMSGNWVYHRESNMANPSLTPFFSDSIWVDCGPIETDPPARDLYSGSDASGGMDRVTIARHGYKAAGLAPRPSSFPALGPSAALPPPKPAESPRPPPPESVASKSLWPLPRNSISPALRTGKSDYRSPCATGNRQQGT